MKRKLLVLILALFIPCALFFSACDFVDEEDNRTKLTSDMLTLQYSSISYDGSEKQPTVTVKIEEEVVPSTEYIVVYSNNSEVGTATVTVTAEEESEIISGSASVNFEITAIATIATNYEEVASALADKTYNRISLTNSITIPEGMTLTIPSGKTLRCGDYSIINNGTIVNNGTITVNADSLARLKEVFEYASHITLTDDIVLNGTKLDINPETRNYTLNIDLNGKSILGYFRIYGKTSYKANVTITNYKNTGVIGTESTQYGIAAIGSNIDLTLFGVDLIGYYGGLCTNGNYEGASISATNCSFTGVSQESGIESSVGAYLPGKHKYSFINCNFVGGSGYYAKSGEHSLIRCSFEGFLANYIEPNYNGNGAEVTGSALVVDSAANYKTPLIVKVNGGTFKSNAYGIEVFTTGETTPYSTVDIYGNLSYNVGIENTRFWYDTWTGNVAEISTQNAINNTIIIRTSAQLAGLAKAVNSGETFKNYTIKLASDIDLNNIEWTPIGYGSSTANDIVNGYVFSGTFDGQNHTIYNLRISRFVGGSANPAASQGVGLFGNIFDATISNLIVKNSDVAGNHYVGTVVGYSHRSIIDKIQLHNVNVTCNYADDDESGDKAGALIGYASVVTKISNCSATNSVVKAVRDAGRLIGFVSETSSYTNCVAGSDCKVLHNEGSAPSDYVKDGSYLTDDIACAR